MEYTGSRMGFWDTLDKVVGFIPVMGTVKDAIEAGVAEAKGNHAAAKEKIIEAVVGITTDILIVATLGASAEVATAGKMAAEEVFKQAEVGAVKTTAEAEALKLGVKAAAVVAAEAAAMAARKKLAKKGRNHHKKKPPKKEPKQKKKTKKSSLPKPPSTKQKKKDPKRGHHVINNGVIRIFRDIIEKFFEQNTNKIFMGESYKELVDEGFINQEETPTLMSSHDQPLPCAIRDQIKAMVAFTPSGESHSENNDVTFGQTKLGLLNAVMHIVFHVFTSLQKKGEMPDLNEAFLHQKVAMIRKATQESDAQSNAQCYYVDSQALNWWLAEGGEMEQFTRCRESVGAMFESLADVTRPPEEWLACTWGQEIFHIHKRLIDRHNLPPRKVIFHPVSFVDNSDEPPDHAIKLGCQTDGVGELWSAVAKTDWGTIPGKAKGNTCWYSYGGEEHLTENFVWLASMQPVQMEKNKGRPPKLAIQCAFQDDGTGYLYAAIAETKWGKIPGKAKDSTCWYPYDGQECRASDFYWLVRSTPDDDDYEEEDEDYAEKEEEEEEEEEEDDDDDDDEDDDDEDDDDDDDEDDDDDDDEDEDEDDDEDDDDDDDDISFS